MTSSIEAGTGRRRKIKAVLAGGVVLGVGAAITLAAWNDSEFAQGIFQTGEFAFQGATAEGAYTDHPTVESAADLAFELGEVASNLTPGDVVEAPFAIQLTGTSDAQIDLTNETTDAATGLSYGVTEHSAFGCDAPETAAVIPTGTALGGAGAADLGVMLQDTERFFCFTVTASPAQAGEAGAIAQGEETVAVWQFEATSVN